MLPEEPRFVSELGQWMHRQFIHHTLFVYQVLRSQHHLATPHQLLISLRCHLECRFLVMYLVVKLL